MPAPKGWLPDRRYPCLIEGAGEGAAPGYQFLKYLKRPRRRLYIVELRPVDGCSPANQLRRLEAELGCYGAKWLATLRWPVVTNMDWLLAEERDQAMRGWKVCPLQTLAGKR